MARKTKNIALLVGFVITLFVCYQLAISKTIQQKEQFETFKQQDILFKNAPKKLSLLKQKEVYYDSLLAQYQLDGSSIQNNLLKTINTFADNNKFKVISFLEPHTVILNDLTIQTYVFVIEGDFNDLNELIYQLEQKTKFGEIVNLHFEKKTNFRSGKQYLQAKVLLKSFG